MVAVNLAILVHARTVTRLGEIAVRTALGASRRRILGQLFIEAFALSLVGAGAGLLLAHLALERMMSLAVSNGSVPFWIVLDLSPATIMYAFALSAHAAAIMGVLPGLKVTGRGVNANLRELDTRTARLGPLWTTLVVAQVAVAVAVLPMAAYLAVEVIRNDLSNHRSRPRLPGLSTRARLIGRTGRLSSGRAWRGSSARAYRLIGDTDLMERARAAAVPVEIREGKTTLSLRLTPLRPFIRDHQH